MRNSLFKDSERTLVMAIINLTPDSFYSRSRVPASDVAELESRIHRAIEDGADFLDLGAESTRPGSPPVDADEECSRLLPAIRLARSITDLPISVDTQKAGVARAALDAGANIVNDISGFRADTAMIDVLRQYSCPAILMHMQGTPATMQNNPRYTDVVGEVLGFLIERATFASDNGAGEICIDPGLGFGKTSAHNLVLLQEMSRFTESDYPVLVGHSRKSFIGRALSKDPDDPDRVLPPEERLSGSLAVAVWCAVQGASIVRTHDVKETRQALTMIAAIRSSVPESFADIKAGAE